MKSGVSLWQLDAIATAASVRFAKFVRTTYTVHLGDVGEGPCTPVREEPEIS